MVMRVICLILIASFLAPLPAFAADSDVRLVKRTRTEKRHYRKKHKQSESSNSSSGENILMGLELLGSVLELASDLQEEEEDEDPEYLDEYAMEGWAEEDGFMSEVFVRASSGLVFQQPVAGRSQNSGTTMLLGVGIAATPDDYSSGIRLAVEGGLWIDDYTLVDAGAVGLYGAVRAGGPWRVVQPYVGMSVGFLGQYGFDALGPTGSFVDFQSGVDIRIRSISVGVLASAGLQLLPSENEEENAEVTGFRQSLALSTAYHF
jgi:hypothetical protein